MSAVAILTWDNVNSNEDGVRIYRDTKSIDKDFLPEPIIVLPPGSDEWHDTTVQHGNTYYYLISVFDSEREKFHAEYVVECDDMIYVGLGSVRYVRFYNSGTSHGDTGFIKLRPSLNTSVFMKHDNSSASVASIDVCPLTKRIAYLSTFFVSGNNSARSTNSRLFIFDQFGNELHSSDYRQSANRSELNQYGKVIFDQDGKLYLSFTSKYSGFTTVTRMIDTEYNITTFSDMRGIISIAPNDNYMYVARPNSSGTIEKYEKGDDTALVSLSGVAEDPVTGEEIDISFPNSIEVDSDGFVYIIFGRVRGQDNEPDENQRISKFTKNLDHIWTIKIDDERWAHDMAIDSYLGRIYISMADFNDTMNGNSGVKCIDFEGNLIWESETLGSVCGTPAIGLSGDIYVSVSNPNENSTSANQNGGIYRLDKSDGSIKRHRDKNLFDGLSSFRPPSAIAVDPGKITMAKGARLL